ncbi:hypothetical protein FA13DRAFT_70126 [Coprinellus micaceus]|uniref:Uncharacterized protein n=1 Tax=Coprinellus micaceus TaxID=71717 RepID=A0A4Y7TJ25_COPMI|nr:hypothetical protein FA13DRAFT_70126 [Coprinellus micaceus]
MADLASSPRPSSSAGDVGRALKTEADDQRDSSSLGLSPSPHISPPPPEQTMPSTQHPQVRPSMANENARRAQEKSEKRPSKTMNIQELVDGPFIRFGTQSEIVLPFQERVAQEDSSRKDLTERLLLLLLETHAWMAARPRRERMHEVEKLEEHVKNTTEIEEQQERAREKLSQFVRHLTNAVQALAQGMNF